MDQSHGLPLESLMAPVFANVCHRLCGACCCPQVPLGMTTTATFHILNRGYDNLDLRFRLPPDESHVPMRIDFPEGACAMIYACCSC